MRPPPSQPVVGNQTVSIGFRDTAGKQRTSAGARSRRSRHRQGETTLKYKFCRNPGQSCQPELGWGAAPDGWRSSQGAATGRNTALATDSKQPAKHKSEPATAATAKQPKHDDEPPAASRERSIHGAASNEQPATAKDVKQPAQHND